MREYSDQPLVLHSCLLNIGFCSILYAYMYYAQYLWIELHSSQLCMDSPPNDVDLAMRALEVGTPAFKRRLWNSCHWYISIKNRGLGFKKYVYDVSFFPQCKCTFVCSLHIHRVYKHFKFCAFSNIGVSYVGMSLT